MTTDTENNTTKKPTNSANSIMLRMSEKFGVDHQVLYNTLSKTCFRKPDGSAPTKEEMVTLLIISEKSNLNPMLGEIYAFPGKQGGIVPIVGINGWRQIATSNPEYAGVRFEFSPEKVTVVGVTAPEWIKCVVTRKRPDGTLFEVEGFAFFEEKFRPTEPWKQQPRQMLCNKAQIQALKNAFPSLSSIYDEEEGRDMAASYAQMEAQKQSQATTRVWSRPQLENKLKEVTQIAAQRNAWAVATKWVMEKTSGADQEFALEFISKARMEKVEVEDVEVVDPPVAKAAEQSDF